MAGGHPARGSAGGGLRKRSPGRNPAPRREAGEILLSIPANILLSDYGEAQLTDFGIARIEGGFETATGAFTGSLSHSAPEVLNGRPPTPQSDIYVLAAALFSIIAGRAAFERREGEEIIAQFLRITGQPIPDLRGHGVPDELCAVLERAMAKDPGDRPASAEAFGRELQEVQHAAGLPVTRMALPVGRRPAGDQTATQAPAAREAQSLHPRGPSPLVERAMAATSEPPRPPEVTRRLDSGTSRPSPAAPPVVESSGDGPRPAAPYGWPAPSSPGRPSQVFPPSRAQPSARPDPAVWTGPHPPCRGSGTASSSSSAQPPRWPWWRRVWAGAPGSIATASATAWEPRHAADLVECAVYAPGCVARGETILLNVFAYLASDALRVDQLASESHKVPPPRIHLPQNGGKPHGPVDIRCIG